jgi:hypothetical protein
VAAVVFLVAQCQAAPIIFAGSNGRLSASAAFDLTPTEVKVTLTNTASAQGLLPADVLTAVYFNLTGGGPLTPMSAVALNGLVQAKPGDPGPGAYWAYKTDFSLHGAHSGITSTGLDGYFGPSGNFGCSNCKKLNGLDYGIVPNNYVGGNGGVEKDPLVKYSAMFTLQGSAANATVSNVWFQYGTDLSSPSFQGFRNPGGEVPEPTPVILIGCGLLLVAISSRIRKRFTRDI